MEIKRISILGLGLIGGSIAKALKNSALELEIYAYDKDDILNSAFQEKNIDKKLNNIYESLDCDLIFICLPVNASIKTFKELVPKLNKATILTDVCGVKYPFQKIWDESASEGIYIGGHPMAGKEKGGYKNSDPLLLENSVYIVTQDLSGNNELSEFRKIIEALGAKILHVPAKQHDIIAASVSHLPQLVSVALVNTASLKTDNYNFLDLAAGGFRDMTRIASSDFEIWEPILSENKNEILTAIDKFIYELERLKSNLKNDNLNEINDSFKQARKSRDEIPQNTKGFLSPLHDIFIFVSDEPGVLSKITTELFKLNINIKDIELLKIREGSGGTFRLSFDSGKDAEKANQILTSQGFRIK
ncbi:MAG: prephenate dehydrogenase/arogenate dehydrogenase family protein [Bacteroidetes bacterium]|nr:prephenate dehydrogenase/arogenate dehydrogenase family protein [Bacteroidota bacterium]